jgi:uncharacterized protein (DUF433 family)
MKAVAGAGLNSRHACTLDRMVTENVGFQMLSLRQDRYTHDFLGRSAMSELHRITVDPNQCGGRPCLRGLRIRVKDVLDLLAAGATREEILEDYSVLEAGDITAVLEYAARQSDHPVLRLA